MNKSMVLVSAISAILFVSPVFASDNERDDDHDETTVVPVVPGNPANVTNSTTVNSTLNDTVSNINRNRNDNVNNLSQNQAQNQNQSATSNATAAGGAGGNATASGGTGGNATASGNGSGNSTNITQNYRDYRPAVNSAYSGSLTSGLDTCLGSASAGVQTQIVGLSGGKTIVDKNCVMIKQVQLLVQLGYPTAACFRARQDSEIDEAMKAAGIECRELPVAVVPQVATEVKPEDPSHPGFDIKSLYK